MEVATTEMVRIHRPCPRCGKEIDVVAGDDFVNGELVWHESYDCPRCGVPVHLDDIGPAPQEVRHAILAAEGEWSLSVSETGSGTIRALKVLRGALDLSLAQAGELRRSIPGIVATGTRAEMTRLWHLLAADGLRAELRCT